MNRLFEQNKRTLNIIKDAVLNFRIQNDYIAYQKSNAVMMLLETVAKLLAEENRVSELEKLLPLLQQALEAMDNQNAVLLADIFQEGIHPLLCSIQSDIFATEENVDVDYWGENRKALRDKYKALYSKLLSVRENISDNYSLSFAKTGEPVLQVRTNEGDVRINSASDPWEEALIFANNAVTEDYSDYLLVGFGMGYHVQAMLNSVFCESLVVLESDIEQIAIATAYKKYTGMINSEKLKIIYCEEPKDYMEWINKCGDTMKCCMWHPSIKSIRDKNLREKLENYWVELLSIKNMGRILDNNFKANIEKHDEEVTSLKGDFSGKTMILAAAGPSLDEGIEVLCNRDKKNTVLVCVGKVARKLIQAGVKPDYIVMTDAKAGTKLWIEGIEASGIPLLYLSTVASTVVEGYQSKRFIAFQEDYLFAEEYAKENGYPLYQSGGSVSTFALDIGIRLGCKTIVCVGLDLGYPSDSTHAKGVGPKLADTKALRKVEGVGGKEVSTSKTLDIYRNWIERRIKNEKGIEFINASGGARIHGMREMPLKEKI